MHAWHLSILLAPLVASCAAAPVQPPHATLPPTIDGARGSADGNYESVQQGEIAGPEGTPCPVFIWDRPLSDGRVLRLRSASCAFAARPGGLVAIELDRKIIPVDESTLGQSQAVP